MRVGLVLESLDPRRGGLEQWTWQFAPQAAASGHEIHIVASHLCEQASALPVTFHRVKPSRSPLARAAAMEQVLRSIPLDVIHDMGCGWYADIFHPHGGSSVAFREHNLLRIPRWRRFRLWREKRYREHARVEARQMADPRAVVVAVSAMVSGHLRTLHQVSEERIRLIPNGVDTEKFSPLHRESLRGPERRRLNASDDETVFLMVAHNLKLKNAEAAIRALAAVVARGIRARLVIAGGKRPKPFIALARKLGLESLVHFVEPADDVRPSYAAADACVHPTWYDPCSLVALEALSSGLPLITTRFNGVSELMRHGVEGFVLDEPADVAGLAECLVSLTGTGARQAMGEAARRLALANTLQQQTERFLSLYEEVAARKGRTVCR